MVFLLDALGRIFCKPSNERRERKSETRLRAKDCNAGLEPDGDPGSATWDKSVAYFQKAKVEGLTCRDRECVVVCAEAQEEE